MDDAVLLYAFSESRFLASAADSCGVDTDS